MALPLTDSRLHLDQFLWTPNGKLRTTAGQLDYTVSGTLLRIGEHIGLTRAYSLFLTQEQTLGVFSPYLSGQVRCVLDSYELQFREATGPQRTLLIRDAQDGSLFLLLTTAAGDLIRLHQLPDGAVAFVSVLKGQVTSLTADSLAKLLASHAPTLGATLIPALEHLGVDVRFSPFTPGVLAAVTVLLSFPAQADALIAQLDDDQFAKREEASRLLNEQFDAVAPLLRARLAAGNLSAEAAARLKAIMDPHAKVNADFALAQSLELATAPGFLIAALDRFPGNAREVVCGQLRKLTQENLPDDPAAWRAWWDQRHPKR